MGLTTTELNLLNVIQPIPIVSIWGGIFALLTLFFINTISTTRVIVKVFIIFVVVFILLFLFIVFWIYFFCLGGENIKKACVVTTIILCLTLVPTLLLLISTDSFVNVFSNSVGYLYYSITENKTINEIFEFNNEILNNDKIFKLNKNVLLTKFNKYNTNNENTNNLLNIDIESFKTYYSNININVQNIEFLNKIVSGKNTIGILSWFYITTVFTSIISIKYLSTI